MCPLSSLQVFIYYAHVCVVPGVVQNLVCAGISSPSELSFSWELPTVLGNEVVGYQVVVNRLEQRAGSREMVQSGIYDNFIETKHVSISGLGKDSCDGQETCFIL